MKSLRPLGWRKESPLDELKNITPRCHTCGRRRLRNQRPSTQGASCGTCGRPFYASKGEIILFIFVVFVVFVLLCWLSTRF